MNHTEIIKSIVSAFVGIIKYDLTTQERRVVDILIKAGYLYYSTEDMVERTSKPVEDE